MDAALKGTYKRIFTSHRLLETFHINYNNAAIWLKLRPKANKGRQYEDGGGIGGGVARQLVRAVCELYSMRDLRGSLGVNPLIALIFI